MKTIFITSFHPHISRNILQTDVLRLLKENKNIFTVLLVPDYKTDYFRKSFGGANVAVEGVKLYQSSKTKTGLFFKKMALLLMPTDTRKIKQEYKLYLDGKKSHWIGFQMANAIGHFSLIRKIFRTADYFLSPRSEVDQIFDAYKPDLVFSTDLHDEHDVGIMQLAKKRKILILGMFRSWDNPTQGILRVFPDKLLAGSKAIADEAAGLQYYPKEKVILVGHPHYDKYRSGARKSKAEFFASFGFDQKKPLIFFTPLGDKFVKKNDIDKYIMGILADIPGAQILVRFPPDEPVDISGFEKPKNMAFDRPGFKFSDGKFNDREIKQEDDDRLVDSILHSDVAVTGPTSIILDSAFFDKPVVAANVFPTKRPFFDTVYCFQFTHLKNAINTGGARYVETKEALIQAVNDYILNPALDKEGRARMRSRWFSHIDGESSLRIVGAVMHILETKTK